MNPTNPLQIKKPKYRYKNVVYMWHPHRKPCQHLDFILVLHKGLWLKYLHMCKRCIYCMWARICGGCVLLCEWDYQTAERVMERAHTFLGWTRFHGLVQDKHCVRDAGGSVSAPIIGPYPFAVYLESVFAVMADRLELLLADGE